jgi:hypothetical protein
MTTAAWITMLVTWTVVIGFAATFFIKVLRAPPRVEDPGNDDVPLGPLQPGAAQPRRRPPGGPRVVLHGDQWRA